MNNDRLFGAFIGLVFGGVLTIFVSAVGLAFDALPSAKYGPLFACLMTLSGALVGYAYVAVWSRWRP